MKGAKISLFFSYRFTLRTTWPIRCEKGVKKDQGLLKKKIDYIFGI